MFSKQGATAIMKDIRNTVLLCNNLDNPHTTFKSIHIGGTNGKGSVSNMLAAILQEAGYRTGLFTSPHLIDFRERIRVNGEMIPESDVVNFVQSQREFIEKINPSFFEVTVAMAFNYFARQKVDIAVVEVGLGGRLDSTNILSPLLSVITNISFDHVAILGNTLKQIAAEKAGIIKNEIPVVIGEAYGEVRDIFVETAQGKNAPIVFAQEEWSIDEDSIIRDNLREIVARPVKNQQEKFGLALDLTGSYQLKNIKTVLSAVDQLKLGGFTISRDHIDSALRRVTRITGLMGRWQILDNNPLVICDTGHNEDGINEVLKNIASIPYENLHMVIGMVKDKDISKILSLLPKEAAYYFCHPSIERAKPSEELADEAKNYGLSGEYFSTVKDALAGARASSKPNDLVFVGGSTFVVAEIL